MIQALENVQTDNEEYSALIEERYLGALRVSPTYDLSLRPRYKSTLPL